MWGETRGRGTENRSKLDSPEARLHAGPSRWLGPAGTRPHPVSRPAAEPLNPAKRGCPSWRATCSRKRNSLRFQDPKNLCQDLFEVRDRAEHEGGKDSIHGLIGEGEGLGQTLDQVDGRFRWPSSSKKMAVHERIRLDTHDIQLPRAGSGGWVRCRIRFPLLCPLGSPGGARFRPSTKAV